MTYYCEIPSPVGRLLLSGDEEALSGISFRGGSRAAAVAAGWRHDREPFRDAIAQLEAYFEGERRDFDLVLAPEGTAFQRGVWDMLRTIPYGETISYGELAARLGCSGSARAVGAANGKNPIPIVIPCHRVIGANGSLTGFGGGLHVKRRLLALEARHRPLRAGNQADLFQ